MKFIHICSFTLYRSKIHRQSCRKSGNMSCISVFVFFFFFKKKSCSWKNYKQTLRFSQIILTPVSKILRLI